MKRYLVGGAVRDLLLGRGISDRDYLVTDAAPAAFLRRYPNARPVGKSFPVFLLDGEEYAWPRGGSLESDLLARDLTINALALAISPEEAGRIFMHPKALSDLKHKVLRPCADTAMADDPLRVYRAARFAAAFPDFSPHPELLAQMRQAAEAGLLPGLFAERVGLEVQKATTAPRPGRFVTLLSQAGCLAPWLAELAGANAIPAGPAPYHDSSVLAHTAAVMDALAAKGEDGLTVWMGLCHDLGKTTTPREEWPHHHGHEKRGEGLAKALGERLRLPNRWIRAGMLAARLHMKAGRYSELRPGSKVDLLDTLHRAGFVERMFGLVKADRGEDCLAQAKRDVAAMLAVHLKEEERELGEASGEKLRLLRCQAIRSADPSSS